MGHLSTHVLDTATGRPAAGIALIVYRVSGTGREEVAHATTNADGRCDEPLLEDESFAAGEYEIHFAIGDYLRGDPSRDDADTSRERDVDGSDAMPFLGTVVIRFGVANADEHYHVPLLVSPFSYSTYRGS